ncbi:MAG: aspartate aminotransferase family protein [Verrucomicrobiota bacterium]|nr:aspartate aminotransferase family protein [Limisphaera sp.]MDW8380857.1 aspartate aminotransferase family protein [Verrucomicrobiota bacterium]
MNSNRGWLRRLRRFEARNVTFVDPDGRWPVVLQRAQGSWIWDVEGRRYLDLTSGFGVAATGHAHPRVVAAARFQMKELLHGMGDVHPHVAKIELARELSRLTYERWGRTRGMRLTGKVIFGCTGFEAVEAALKTALLVTGRPAVVAFEGGYHGLGYGALNVTHREYFWRPFEPQLRRFAGFAPFPGSEEDLPQVERWLEEQHARTPVGAVLVEPVQGRGGIRVPPVSFLNRLRAWCDRRNALLILDEIFTGFGRTGAWFACEHSGVIPDMVCLGKALTGGFPLSVCVGRADLMDMAWPPSSGEALHTSTFQGHPVGCRMALAQLAVLRELRLPCRARQVGAWLVRQLELLPPVSGLQWEVRGQGLMVGLEVRHVDGRPATDVVLEALKQMLARGFLLLPEGPAAEVLAFTPPLTIEHSYLQKAVEALGESLATAVRRVESRSGDRHEAV